METNKVSNIDSKALWVVKIGSSLLTKHGQCLDHERIANWVGQIAHLYQKGIKVVLVSSGAVAAGMVQMGWQQRPKKVSQLQAAASLGQTLLVQQYHSVFERYGLNAAQILLTHEDLSDRQRYLNARNTLQALKSMSVVPIVNENDTVTTDEIRLGDNDTLGALVANLVEADRLILLTDQQGLFDADPRSDDSAQLITTASATDSRLLAVAGEAGRLGTGGMATKVRAARLAARSGTDTIIAGGYIDDVLLRLFQGESIGTHLTAGIEIIAARKQWLAGHLQLKGALSVDAGAVRALTQDNKSLLSVGVTSVVGHFKRGECVAIKDPQNQEIGRGLINYDVTDVRRIIGKNSGQIEMILGYLYEPELIDRDNLVLV